MQTLARPLKASLLSLLGVLFSLAAPAAFLESDHGSSSQGSGVTRPEPPVEIIRPRPRPRPDNEVSDLVRRIRVENPYSHGHLLVFPLTLSPSTNPADVRTLDEAVQNGWILIREKGTPTVPTVAVRNESHRHVFLLSGEVLTGGKQNRVIRDDVLLPPRSGFIDVPVYCVQKGRWQGAQDSFGASPVMVHPRLRRSAAKGVAQDQIWSEIESYGRATGARSSTTDYHEMCESPAVRRRVDDLIPHFRRLPRRGTVGIVAVAGNRILGCDVFADSRVFTQLWDKILRSYALDYVAHRDWHRPSIGRGDVRTFLDRVYGAHCHDQGTPGVGRRVTIAGTVEGTALVWNRTAVHVNLHPAVWRHPPVPEPMPIPQPRPWRE